LISLIWTLAFASAATSQDTASRIKNEAERLQKSLKEKPVSDPNFAEVGNMVIAALQASTQASDAGYFYLSLENLGRAESLAGGVRAMVDKAPVAKSGLPAFESEWGAASLRLDALGKEAHARKWDTAPLGIRALSEAAQGKAVPLLDGARGFAVANGPADGLFYMGQAEGEAEFAKFCSTLSLPAAKPKLPLRSYVPELNALQARTNAAFQPPRSIELHSRFIALNSAIKLAEELDSARFHAGALYQYLEAIRHYGMLDAPPLDAAKQPQLKEDLVAAQKRLNASTNDDSIAQLFLERAESQTSHADGSAPSADDWRSAQVIVAQVLPAYYEARKPAPPFQKASGKTVEITLVRWPYT
jgi:hypothetical protein